MFQFAVPTFESVFGRMAKGNSPFGAWVVCVYRTKASLEPQGGRCNDLRPFCILLKLVRFLADGANSRGVNDGGCYG